MLGRGVTGVKRDADSLEMKIIAEHSINIIFIKGRIAEKSRVSVPKVRVSGEKVQEYRFKRGRIADFLVKGWVISFL